MNRRLLSVAAAVAVIIMLKLRRQQTFRDRNTWPVQDAVVAPQSTVQKQKAKEATSHYSEKELLRLLIRYGSEVLLRETDKESGTETVTTVADYIITQITEDELEFEDPLFAKIFSEITFLVSQGLVASERHFVQHRDPDISSIVVDMLTEQYTLSGIWSARGAFVETEEMKLKDIVPDSILKFKSDKIKVMQKEIRKAMAEAAGDDTQIAELQERYKAMTSLQKKISTGLGGRIVL